VAVRLSSGGPAAGSAATRSGSHLEILLLASRENQKDICERLGHTKVGFTLDRHAHVLPGMQERAAGKLEAILFGG